MKQLLLLLHFIIVFATLATAQTYFVNSSSGNNNYPFNNTSGNKCQYLYLKSDFGSPPAGTITKIYIRPASNATNATYNNFTIQMGMTSISAFSSATYITTGMTPVLTGNPYVIPTVTANTWLMFTLSTPFVYDGVSNIVVEYSSQSFSNGFTIFENALTGRRIYGSYGNSTGGGFDGEQPGFGFDILTCPNPVLSAQPANQSICSGSNTAFSVTATNASTYQWQVNTGSSFTNISNGGIYSGATTSTLSLTNATSSYNNYQYRCIVTGACSNPVTSGSATLTILPAANITSQTIADTVCSGAPASMNVAATGPIVAYKWQMAVATVGLFYDVPAQFPFSGVTSSVLNIAEVPDTLNGYIFKCLVTATGTCGNAVSNVIPVEVLIPPKITTHPTSASIMHGLDASFTIGVTGNNYISYWQASTDNINFSNINDNSLYHNVHTNTLQVAGPPLSLTGWWFRCIIKSTELNCSEYRDTSESAQLEIKLPTNGISTVMSANIKGISVSPNPVKGDQLFLYSENDLENAEVRITDNIGKTVYTGIISLNHSGVIATPQTNTATLPVSQLAPGVYTLQVRNNGSAAPVTTRFTRQ